jgi:hypothetical protein
MASGEDGATEVAEQTNTGGHEPNNLSQHEKVKADDDMAASDAFDSSIPGINPNSGAGDNEATLEEVSRHEMGSEAQPSAAREETESHAAPNDTDGYVPPSLDAGAVDGRGGSRSGDDDDEQLRSSASHREGNAAENEYISEAATTIDENGKGSSTGSGQLQKVVATEEERPVCAVPEASDAQQEGRSAEGCEPVAATEEQLPQDIHEESATRADSSSAPVAANDLSSNVLPDMDDDFETSSSDEEDPKVVAPGQQLEAVSGTPPSAQEPVEKAPSDVSSLDYANDIFD